MKKTIAALLGLAAAAFAVPAAAQSPIPSGDYVVDARHVSAMVSVKHLGLSTYVMRFEKVDIELSLDVENLANSSVTATIDPTSISTPLLDDGAFNAEISNGFLNAAAHPTITFVSTSVEPTGDTTATVTGDLTMLGVTNEITMEVELTGAIESHPFASVPAIGFMATGSIDRTAFGSNDLTQTVGNGAAVVSPTVDFAISAEFVKAE